MREKQLFKCALFLCSSNVCVYVFYALICLITGQFGRVYSAFLSHPNEKLPEERVAVKTMKCMKDISKDLLFFRL